MGMSVAEGMNYTRFTGNGNISLGGLQNANLFGVMPSNGNSAGLSIVDVGGNQPGGAAANTTILNNAPLTSGQFLPVPCQFTGGLRFTASVGCDFTVFWAPK